MKRALVLNYHLIDSKSYEFDAFGGIYAVPQKCFEQQMAFLKALNIKIVSLNEIQENNVETEFCVALTFDDGNPSDFEIVYPTLKKYGYTATFFLSVQNMDKNGVTWEKFRKMYREGFIIGSHGMTHKDLTMISQSELNFELLQSKNIIEKHTGASIQYFSLPFGRYNSKIIKRAKEIGYKGMLTTQFNMLNLDQNNFIIDRWSIKRKTSIHDFMAIIKRHRIIVKRYQIVSAFKKFIVSGMGSTLINKLNTFKNKYF